MNEYRNKLFDESSAYLLQHKNNPVHWFSWGDEAIEESQRTQKPILLSIGYASCHWCHVMAHESFEDIETAKLMNELFVNIKVDREERPDIDEIYLEAVQIMSGHGGWPLTVFLTPELKPFFGGTYYPLESKYGQPSFKDVLVSVSQFFSQNKKDVYSKSEEIFTYLKSFSHETSKIKFEEIIGNKNLTLDIIAQNLSQIYADFIKILENEMDKIKGGFGRAPKFPQPSKLSAFLFSDNNYYVAHAILSLNQIGCGGITDQIGGGVSRYSVDSNWIVPHFEKMLYDNAQLLSLFAAASIITQEKNAFLSQVLKNYAYEIFQYLNRDLKCPKNSIYFSSEDADSEGEEGVFYVFLQEEFKEIFSQDLKLLDFAQRFYKVTNNGNFEGFNILTAPENLESYCNSFSISTEECFMLRESARKKIFEYRDKRVRPGLDDKCILGWNALLVTALLQSSVYLNDSSLLKSGLDLLKNLLKTFQVENKFYHCTAKNSLKIFAFVDDMAFLLEACCEALLLTGCNELFNEIDKLSQYIYDNFCDTAAGIIYYCEQNKDLIHRPVKQEDNVIYSANSAILGSFVKINSLLNRQNNRYMPIESFKLFENIALIALSNSAVLANKVPTSCAQMLQKIKWLEKEKLIFIDNKAEATDLSQFTQVTREFFKNQRGMLIICCSVNNRFALDELSNYSNKVQNNNTEYFYCDRDGCRLPAKNVSELFQSMNQ